MASPDSAIQRWDLALTFAEFDLAAQQAKMIGHRICPKMPVALQSANAGRIPIETLLKNRYTDTKRAADGGLLRNRSAWEDWTYKCEARGFEGVIDEVNAAIYRDVIDIEALETMVAVATLIRSYERDCASKAHDITTHTGAAGNYTDVSNEWSVHADATPLADVKAAKDAIIAKCGVAPDTLQLNETQLYHAKHCDEVTDRFKSGGMSQAINLAALAEEFGVAQILVAKDDAVYNSANEGKTAVLAKVWSNSYVWLGNCGVGEIDPTAPISMVTPVCTNLGPFSASVAGEEPIAVSVEQYYEKEHSASIVSAKTNWGLEDKYVESSHLLGAIL